MTQVSSGVTGRENRKEKLSMSKRFLTSILTTVSMLILLTSPAAAQSAAAAKSAAERAKWARDFNGVWSPAGAQQDITENLLPGEEISLTRFGAEQYLKIDEADSPAYRCEPYGPTRIMSSALPFQIFQLPDVIGMVFEHIDYRIIYMNGKHPDEITDYPEWEGHSIGRWEGDTLVVDTVGARDDSWLDSFGLQHSVQMHMIERYRKTSPDTYIWTVTIEDPVYFTKPFTYAFNVVRDEYRVMPDRCADTPPDDKYVKTRGKVGAKHQITPTFPAGMVARRPDGVPLGPVGQRGGRGQQPRSAPVLKTKFEDDIIKTNRGDLKITSIANTSLMFTFENKVIYVDPVGSRADFSSLPKADAILVTHFEDDHLDPKTVEALSTNKTALIVCPHCSKDLPKGTIMINGETETVAGLKVESVAAYNIIGRGGNGKPNTARGSANGYVITFGDKRVYVAGKTENVPEVKALKQIEVAFLPVNNVGITGGATGLRTMNQAMFVDAAKAIRPKILFPYNYGNNDPKFLADLLKAEPTIEVRVRDLK
jgi:L-ascorbate metabolism protein UlaG (beta-lactamase superfamily)